MVKQWEMKGDTFSDDKSKTGGESNVCVCICGCGWKQDGNEGSQVGGLTYAHIFIIQFCRGIAVVAQLA